VTIRLLGRLAAACLIVACAAAARASAQSPLPSAAQRPTFRSGVDLVSLSAVVRDRKGRFVPNLTLRDFSVFEGLDQRRIVEFQANSDGPLSVTMLVDVSGSMRQEVKEGRAKLTARVLLDTLDARRDEASVMSFDSRIQQVTDFTSNLRSLSQQLGALDPFGQTSIFDATALAAKRAATREGRRRAVVVITDGVDTASRLSASEVSGIASAIEVPVYAVAVVSPVDHPGDAAALEGPTMSMVAGTLRNLVEWTGGQVFYVSAPAHASSAARQIVDELRRQYLIAFEPSGPPGWRQLTVKTRDRNHTVRTRGGYFYGVGEAGARTSEQ
jgi:Ca-activated chloride channel family protein